jgi:hypothetical protein
MTNAAKLQAAIAAEQAANKAVAAYDAYLFANPTSATFDDLKADLLAADAAEACAKAARLTKAAGRNGSYDAARAVEFRAIAGSLAA